MVLKKWLFTGSVFHQRFLPKPHSLKQSVFFVRFPLSQVDKLENLVFSVDSWNFLSFQTRDHGDRNGGNLWDWAQQKLKSEGYTEVITEIEIQTFPRIFGYVFNPVSFWYCYNGSRLLAVIAEVNNTFGGSHSYVVSPTDLSVEKVFHVSPFFQIDGSYQFKFNNHHDRVAVTIKYLKNNQEQFVAHINGTAQEWTVSNLLKAWLKNPIMTFYIIISIHVHALRLYLKKITFFGKNGRIGEKNA